MTIREAKREDLEKIKELCEKYKLSISNEAKVIIAETNGGRIEAIAGIRLVPMIEPFISENPLAGKKLWDRIERTIKENNVRIVRCFTEPKNEKLFKKLGFYRIFKKHLSLEKIYRR